MYIKSDHIKSSEAINSLPRKYNYSIVRDSPYFAPENCGGMALSGWAAVTVSQSSADKITRVRVSKIRALNKITGSTHDFNGQNPTQNKDVITSKLIEDISRYSRTLKFKRDEITKQEVNNTFLIRININEV